MTEGYIKGSTLYRAQFSVEEGRRLTFANERNATVWVREFAGLGYTIRQNGAVVDTDVPRKVVEEVAR
jgi:hypothetical protein